MSIQRESMRWTQPLTPAEQAMINHVSADKCLDSKMSRGAKSSTIRGSVLRHLLTYDQWPVPPKGVRLVGITIRGPLNLESATLRCPLVCKGCSFESSEPLNLAYATASRIALQTCTLAGFQGTMLTVTQELDLSDSIFSGLDDATLQLTEAEVSGNLNLTDVKVNVRQGQYALLGDGIKAGDVLLDKAIVRGALKLQSAEIGKLSLRGAKLFGTDKWGRTFVADELRTLSALLDDYKCESGDTIRFKSLGAIRLPGAEIDGQLSFRGAQLGQDTRGLSLLACDLKVAGLMAIDEGFEATGTVNINGATVGSILFVGGKFSAGNALLASGLRVGHELRWHPKEPVKGLVDLERAAVHRLVDDSPSASWPPEGKLRLSDFTYDSLGGKNPGTCKDRLDWIRRSHRTAPKGQLASFASQPYEQLARIYRQNGQEREAIEISIARHNDLRTYAHLNRWRRITSHVLDKTIKHGYRPLQAVFLLAIVYAAVLFALWSAQHHDGLIVPAKTTSGLTPAPTARHCTANYPCFYPVGYAVDTVIPLINTKQADSWRINGSLPWAWILVSLTWIGTALGWALSTLAVAGYTGLIRKH